MKQSPCRAAASFNLEGSVRRGETFAASAPVGRRLIEAGLNEAAVGLALWVECLGLLAAAVIAVVDRKWLGVPAVSGGG